MKKSRFSFLLLLLSCVSFNGQAIEPEYNIDSKELSVSGVKVGDLFYDVKLKRIEDSDDGSIRLQLTNADQVAKGCSAENASKFRGIKNGWNLDQVNTEIECAGVPESTKFEDGVLKQRYKWRFNGTPDTASIVLFFEQDKLILQ